MAREKLKALITDIIEKTGKDSDTGFKQSARHITDTLIEFKSFDDILAHWYEKQARKITGIAKVKGGRIQKERWPFFIRQRYKAFAIYRKKMKEGLAPLKYVHIMWDKRNEFVFRYYSWLDPSPGRGARDIKNKIDRPAMEAVAEYVENVWRKREQKWLKANPGTKANPNRGYVEKDAAIGTPADRRHPGAPIKGLATGFAHGLHKDVGFTGDAKFNRSGGGGAEVGSTTGAVGVLDSILTGELAAAFGPSNPIVEEFTDDIVDMFVTEGNIQIGDFSDATGEHKNIIRIWGHVSSSRDNTNKMRRWDMADYLKKIDSEDYFPEHDEVGIALKKFRKNKYHIVPEMKGFNEQYTILGGQNLEVHDEQLVVAEGASVAQMTRAFKKFSGGKLERRKLLSRFIDMVAA